MTTFDDSARVQMMEAIRVSNQFSKMMSIQRI